jgi:hypothetical protein
MSQCPIIDGDELPVKSIKRVGERRMQLGVLSLEARFRQSSKHIHGQSRAPAHLRRPLGRIHDTSRCW